MDNQTSEADSYRYERKLAVRNLTKHEVELQVKLHPAAFVTHYPPRFVNSLYFDSVNLEIYLDNVNGHKERLKVRIRWYGNLCGLIREPILEFKHKNGSLGRKESFPLEPFLLDETLHIESVHQVLVNSEIPSHCRLHLYASEPTLISRYKRNYYISVDKKYRMTIDSDLEFYQFGPHSNLFLHRIVDPATTVVELKYGPDEDQHAEWITSKFPFRMTRNSKYISGIDALYPT